MSIQHIALVLEADGLCAQEKAVLTAFCNHTDASGKTFAGEQRLMREAGMPRTTFRKWRARLVDRNLLLSKRKGRKGGGRTSSDTWVNLRALRAAQDPFFTEQPDGAPADEDPFSQVNSNEPEDGPKGESNGPEGGPKGGGNGPADGTFNEPADGTTQGPLTGPEPSDNPQREPLRPSVEPQPQEEHGRTDGKKPPRQIGRNPGVDLLLAIGNEKPEFLLTGKTLEDQGRMVAGMLLEGWTEAQLRHVIAGRPLPDDITTTIGGVISGRLREALKSPPPKAAEPEPAPKAAPVPTARCPRHPAAPDTTGGRCLDCVTEARESRVSKPVGVAAVPAAEARAAVLASKGKHRVGR